MRLSTLSSVLFSLITTTHASLAPNNMNPNPNATALFTYATSFPDNTHAQNLLLPRQGVAPAVNPAPVPPAAVQMPAVTTYSIHGPGGALMNIPYTQLFSATPDPWPAPTAGTIGLGSIVGTVGVVKTGSVSKRSLSVETGVVGRVRDRFGYLGVERRRAQGSADVLGVPSILGMGAAVGFVLAVGIL